MLIWVLGEFSARDPVETFGVLLFAAHNPVE
jgi:hypothetical protein